MLVYYNTKEIGMVISGEDDGFSRIYTAISIVKVKVLPWPGSLLTSIVPP
jgi:hypothetical protein